MTDRNGCPAVQGDDTKVLILATSRHEYSATRGTPVCTVGLSMVLYRIAALRSGVFGGESPVVAASDSWSFELVAT